MTRAFFPLLLCVSMAAQPLPTSTPEKEGISPERLSRVHSMVESLVKDLKRSGAITMIVRNGKIVDWKTYGYRDIEAKLRMERDTICAIASMTKTISSVAVLMLLEEGRFEVHATQHLLRQAGRQVEPDGCAIGLAPRLPSPVHLAATLLRWSDIAREIRRLKTHSCPAIDDRG